MLTRTVLGLLLAISMLSLGACTERDEARVKQKTREAGQELKEAGQEAKKELKEAGQEIKEGLKKAKKEVHEATRDK